MVPVIYDCYNANPDDPGSIKKDIDTMTKHAEILLAAFHQAAPNASLCISLTTPPNSREEAFQANDGGKYHRWGWKRIQHRLIQRLIADFAGRETDRIYLVPTPLNIDPRDGYPLDNAVHPNAQGYHQISASIYSFLKHRLEARR